MILVRYMYNPIYIKFILTHRLNSKPPIAASAKGINGLVSASAIAIALGAAKAFALVLITYKFARTIRTDVINKIGNFMIFFSMPFVKQFVHTNEWSRLNNCFPVRLSHVYIFQSVTGYLFGVIANECFIFFMCEKSARTSLKDCDRHAFLIAILHSLHARWC